MQLLTTATRLALLNTELLFPLMGTANSQSQSSDRSRQPITQLRQETKANHRAQTGVDNQSHSSDRNQQWLQCIHTHTHTNKILTPMNHQGVIRSRFDDACAIQ